MGSQFVNPSAEVTNTDDLFPSGTIITYLWQRGFPLPEGWRLFQEPLWFGTEEWDEDDPNPYQPGRSTYVMLIKDET